MPLMAARPRRDETPSQRNPTIGFRFATVAALIRHGYSHGKAEALVKTWERYARYAMLSGKTPDNTARHLAKFEQFQSPWSSRDPDRRERLVNREIAKDPRRHAASVSSGEHARVIDEIANQIERGGIDDKRHDTARLAAHVVNEPPPHRTRSKTRPRARYS